jgi:hypothetical protein
VIEAADRMCEPWQLELAVEVYGEVRSVAIVDRRSRLFGQPESAASTRSSY